MTINANTTVQGRITGPAAALFAAGYACSESNARRSHERDLKRIKNRETLYTHESPETFYREGRKLGCSPQELQQDLRGWAGVSQGIDYSKSESYEIFETQTGKFITGNKQTEISIQKVEKGKKSKVISETWSKPDLYSGSQQVVSLDLGSGITFTNLFSRSSEDELIKVETVEPIEDFFRSDDWFQRSQFLEQNEGTHFTFSTLESLSNTDGGIAFIVGFWAALSFSFSKLLWRQITKSFANRCVVSNYKKGKLTSKQAARLLGLICGYSRKESFDLLEFTKNPTTKPVGRPGTGDTISNSFAAFLRSDAVRELCNILLFFGLAFLSFCIFLDFGLFGITLELLSVFLMQHWWKRYPSKD